MPSRAPTDAADEVCLDPLSLLQQLVQDLAVLGAEGDADAADAQLHAQRALQRAQAEREDALQRAARVLRTGDDAAAESLASAELRRRVLCAALAPARAALTQRATSATPPRVEQQLQTVEAALSRVSPEAAALLGLQTAEDTPAPVAADAGACEPAAESATSRAGQRNRSLTRRG
jgi:hypothetical protein